jgi:hypothetical protein
MDGDGIKKTFTGFSQLATVDNLSDGRGCGCGRGRYGNATTPRQGRGNVQCREGRWGNENQKSRAVMSSVSGHASRQPRNRIVDPFFAIGHQRTSQAAGCRTGLHKPSSWLSPGMNCRGITFLRCDKDLALAAYPVRAFDGGWGFKLPSREGGKRLARPLQFQVGKVVCYEVRT